MYSTLHTDLTDNTLTVTINRPEKLNALNKTVISELDEVVAEIYKNKDIRSAILTGAGQKAFVAGADISEFQGLSGEEGMALARKGQDLFFRIVSSPKPIVAAVNGFALGGGCELALACHFRVCVPTAKFGQPEVNLGLIPGYGGTQRLTQLIGRGRALEIIMTGRMVEATEAHVMGLVNYIVEADELLVKTRELLSIIQEKAPLAIARVIECVNIAAGDGIDYGRADWEADPFGGEGASSHELRAASSEEGDAWNGFLREQEAFGECFVSEDMKEGIAAFLGKRKPRFKGV